MISEHKCVSLIYSLVDIAVIDVVQVHTIWDRVKKEMKRELFFDNKGWQNNHQRECVCARAFFCSFVLLSLTFAASLGTSLARTPPPLMVLCVLHLKHM